MNNDILKETSLQIQDLNRQFIVGGVAQQYIVIRSQQPDEVILEANVAGLVHLASELLQLASQATEGAHYHLDESGMADSADPSIVMVFKKAEWDK